MIKRSSSLSILILMAVSLWGQSHSSDILRLMRLANDYFMETVPDPSLDSHTDKVRPSHIWTRGVYYEGLMALYALDPQERYIDYTDWWASSHGWAPRSASSESAWKVHADDQCCTQTYMTRYFQSGDDMMYAKAKEDFDKEMARSQYQYWSWIDALQMAMPAYAMMYRITGERKYMDYAMTSYKWTRNTCGNGLFIVNKGVWWRDAKLVSSSEGWWSRGNGWVLAAQVRVMDQLDSLLSMTAQDREDYELVKSDYLAMCKALPSYQREDGFWNASLDKATYAGKELTGTALFLYGLAWGINRGYLSETEYGDVVRKAWEACASCVHDGCEGCERKDGFLGYVQGTADRPSKGYPFTFTAVPNFEDYGLGCFLLGASEYYRLCERQEKATGIVSVSSVSRSTATSRPYGSIDNSFYSLSGVRIMHPSKGLYIHKGKVMKK